MLQKGQERPQREYEQAVEAGAVASFPIAHAAVMWRDVMLHAPTAGQGMFRGYITLDFRGTPPLPASTSPSLTQCAFAEYSKVEQAQMV